MTEMLVPRENRREEQGSHAVVLSVDLVTFFCVSAPGHNLLLSKVSCVCVCVCDEKRHEMHCWEEDIY